ncbi:hypothetical protein [Rhodopirellula sallentina]|uniref:Putative membrane protein n=1 Tax=Rhodopirellula sallentina SM41 TaxID=1263870 RepID=M5U703_9BACT|nr:hypothetical protein [Rhodopirellula sallentina]EMI53661.1 putative membrane protein [Rhodopirellula sallentina SM41]
MPNISTESVSSRERRLEFAIGRGWWIVPTVYFVGQFIAFFLIELVTGFKGLSPLDWLLFISLTVGSPTVAAILFSPGFRWRHFAMGCVALMLSSIVFSFEGEAVFSFLVVSSVVAAIQVFFMRLSRMPPWVIRPARAKRHQKASIGWLLGMTVVAAVLIAVIRVEDDSRLYLTAFAYLGLAVLAGLMGNVIAFWRRPWLRWSVVLLVMGVGWGGMLAADAGILSLAAWESIERMDRYVSKIVCLAPAAALANVVVVHRAMRIQFSRSGKPDWGRRPANASVVRH